MEFKDLRLWLERARENAEKCFICRRIGEASDPANGALKPLKMSGMELSPDVQLRHLALCVGTRERRR